MLQYFDSRITKNNPSIFEHIQGKFWNTIVTYVLDRRFRKSYNLRNWIKEQITNPSEVVLKELKEVPHHPNDYDRQALEILKWVTARTKYTGDHKTWGVLEKWQTAEETIQLRTGDCEDGAILIYVLSVLKGIPPNRLLIMAGNVYDPFTKKTAGHAWVAYRPYSYPLNPVFLDWCYYYNPNKMDVRSKFYVDSKNNIHEYQGDIEGREVDSNYYTMWFAFNSEVSHRNLIYIL